MDILSLDGSVIVEMEENVEGTSVDSVSGYRVVISVEDMEDEDGISVVDVIEREKISIVVMSVTNGDV